MKKSLIITLIVLGVLIVGGILWTLNFKNFGKGGESSYSGHNFITIPKMSLDYSIDFVITNGSQKDYDGLEKIEFSEEKVGCIALLPGIYGRLLNETIINSQEEYDELYENWLDPICVRHFPDVFNKSFEIIPIDFSQKTLIGKHVSGSGCSVEINRAVYKDDFNKKIIYEIELIEEGSCE